MLDTGRRMIRLEMDRVLAASRKKNFLAALDVVYEEHAQHLSAALAAPLDCRDILAGGVVNGNVIEDYLARSRDLLLTASECQATELQTQVEACVSDWEARASEFLTPAGA